MPQIECPKFSEAQVLVVTKASCSKEGGSPDLSAVT